MQLQKVIERLGYSSKEAKVYLAALSLGESRVSDIAAKAHVPRTSAQAIVDALHADGLLNFYIQRRYKYWVAENPERLLANLLQRENALREALPELIELRKKGRAKRSGKDGSETATALFRMVADTSAQPILVANSSAEIMYVNEAWERQFGYALDEVRGQNPRMLQSGKTPREVFVRMWRLLKEEKMFQSDEVVDKRKDGTYFNLLTTVLPVRHGQSLYYIQIIDDITEKKRAEALGKRMRAAASRNS